MLGHLIRAAPRWIQTYVDAILDVSRTTQLSLSNSSTSTFSFFKKGIVVEIVGRKQPPSDGVRFVDTWGSFYCSWGGNEPLFEDSLPAHSRPHQ